MIITSLNNEHIKELNKLKEKKDRDKTNTFLIEGEHLVNEALKYNLIEELIILENVSFNTNIKTTIVSKEVMKKLSSMESYPNVIGICKKVNNNGIGKKILLLEDIQDPGNLGTIIRSSRAFDIDTIVLSPRTVDLYNPKVIRATQGMLFTSSIIIEEPEKIIEKLKEENYEILGTKVDGGKNIKDIEKPDKFVLIIGNEGQGMSEKISSLCDEYLYIKMNDKVESLNASVAASILLYELGNK